jgi:hypothetical protein
LPVTRSYPLIHGHHIALPETWPEQRPCIAKINHVGANNLIRGILTDEPHTSFCSIFAFRGLRKLHVHREWFVIVISLNKKVTGTCPRIVVIREDEMQFVILFVIAYQTNPVEFVSGVGL